MLARTLVLTLVTAAVAAGCMTKKYVPKSSKSVSRVYVAPKDYQSHRDQQKIFASNAGKMAFTDHGEGKTIVLLHGVPTSSWMYRKVIPLLQSRHRVVAIDLLGYGSSEKPDRKTTDYSSKAHAKRVQSLLAALNISEYSLMFHDMGGLVAWEMLASQPKDISNLVVLNTIVGEKGFNKPKFGGDFMISQMTKAFKSKLTSAAVMRFTLKNLGLGGEHKLSEDECYGYVQPMREGANDALYAFFTSLDDELFTDLDEKRKTWPSYTGKMLVLWGAKDDILTQKQIPTLKSAFDIPASRIHIYKKHAHFLAEEIPREVTRKVIGFLR